MLFDVTVNQVRIGSDSLVRDDVNVAFVETFVVASCLILWLGMEGGKDAEGRLLCMEQSRRQAKEDTDRQNYRENREVDFMPKEF